MHASLNIHNLCSGIRQAELILNQQRWRLREMKFAISCIKVKDIITYIRDQINS